MSFPKTLFSLKNFFRTFAQNSKMGLFTISVWLTEYHPQQTGILPQTLQMAEHSPLARAGEKVDKLDFLHMFWKIGLWIMCITLCITLFSKLFIVDKTKSYPPHVLFANFVPIPHMLT